MAPVVLGFLREIGAKGRSGSWGQSIDLAGSSRPSATINATCPPLFASLEWGFLGLLTGC